MELKKRIEEHEQDETVVRVEEKGETADKEGITRLQTKEIKD